MLGKLKTGKARILLASLALSGLTIATGCHSHTPDSGLSNPAVQAGRVDTPQASATKVANAGVAIVSACAKEPYSNASQGLIAAEPGLHEDVLDLRDRATLRAVPFGLNETERLQSLLLKENTAYSDAQAACIQQFAAHLQDLTGPLIESDKEQKQLDISAFDKASKEADQQTEEQTQQEEKAIQSAPSTNQ